MTDVVDYIVGKELTKLVKLIDNIGLALVAASLPDPTDQDVEFVYGYEKLKVKQNDRYIMRSVNEIKAELRVKYAKEIIKITMK